MMNNFNNNFGGGYNGYYTGFNGVSGYTKPVEPSMTNPLTDEDRKYLAGQGKTQFSLEVPREDMLRAYCTHRNPQTKQYTLIPNDDGTVTCSQCGTTFTPVSCSKEEVEDVINRFRNIMETTKTNYVNLPAAAIKQFWQIEPLAMKLPEMYERSVRDSNSVLNTQFGYNQPSYMSNGFGILDGVTSGGYYGQPMPNQGFGQPAGYGQQMPNQMPNQGFGQPVGYGQQMPNQGFGQPAGYGQQMPNQSMQQPNVEANPFAAYQTPTADQQQSQTQQKPNEVKVSKKLSD